MIKSGWFSIARNATALLLLEGGIRIASAETITLTLSNGDKIQGKLVTSESSDTVTVIDHPSLGKLKIQSTALKAKPKKKAMDRKLLSRNYRIEYRSRQRPRQHISTHHAI